MFKKRVFLNNKKRVFYICGSNIGLHFPVGFRILPLKHLDMFQKRKKPRNLGANVSTMPQATTESENVLQRSNDIKKKRKQY